MKLCGFDVGLEHPLFLIAGPCVVESEQLQLDVAGQLKEITGRLGIPGGPLSTASTKSFRLPFGHGVTTAPSHGREPVRIAANFDIGRFRNAPPVLRTGQNIIIAILQNCKLRY